MRGGALGLAAFFQMAQARVEDFFHAAELGTPQIAHVIESAVDGVEAGIQMRGERGRDKTEHSGVEEHWNADREIQLLVGHQSLVRSA